MGKYATEEELALFERLITAVRSIAYGDRAGPTGLEAVAMAISGEGPPGTASVGEGLLAIAESNQAIADAINRLAATQEPMTP
jgi:hypothetical protein